MIPKFRIFINGQFYYFGWLGDGWYAPPRRADLTRSLTEMVEQSDQFTGNFDKRGAEIFAGDIIRFGDSTRVVIRWVKTRFEAVAINPEHSYPKSYAYWAGGNIEKIGDVYFNPELLETI